MSLRVVLCLLAWLHPFGNAFPCVFEAETATFDICELQLDGSSTPFYEVYDDRDEYEWNFTYVFNVAENVLSPPFVFGSTVESMCINDTLRTLNHKPLGPCQDESINATGNECLHDGIQPIAGLTAVYQLHRKPTHHDCFRLHDGITPPEFQLNNLIDPTEGFRLVYRNGDWCAHSARNREFSINFICADVIENVPDKEEAIVEGAEEEDDDAGCYYTMEYYSTFGCPTACPVVPNPKTGDEHLCAGNGRCSYDETNSRAMCFCFTGYYGDDCTLTSDPNEKVKVRENDEGWTGGLIVLVFILTISLIVVFYLLRRIYYEKIVVDDKELDLSELQRGDRAKSGKQAVLLDETSPNIDVVIS